MQSLQVDKSPIETTWEVNKTCASRGISDKTCTNLITSTRFSEHGIRNSGRGFMRKRWKAHVPSFSPRVLSSKASSVLLLTVVSCFSSYHRRKTTTREREREKWSVSTWIVLCLFFILLILCIYERGNMRLEKRWKCASNRMNRPKIKNGCKALFFCCYFVCCFLLFRLVFESRSHCSANAVKLLRTQNSAHKNASTKCEIFADPRDLQLVVLFHR